MKRAEGLAILTRCADAFGTHWSRGIPWSAEECPTCHGSNDAGHLGTPCSRYGSTARECAPVAWRLAYVLSRETGEDITEDLLDACMSSVMNEESPAGVAYTIRNYGGGKYR